MRFKYLTWLLVMTIMSSVAQANGVVDQECYRISNKLASVKLAECVDRDLVASLGRSVNDAPILSKEYPPLPGRTPKGRVMIIGGLHGDEYSSVTIMFKWMKILDRYHSGLFHWKAIPLANPDGLLRKKSQRMNENGVDLNRNFPTLDWHKESRHYWVERTKRNPRRYPGEAPLSEPETRWLSNEIEEFSPDVIVSVHAPHGILDFDGPQAAPKRLGNLHLNLLGTYPGSLGNYAGVGKKIPVITIELPSAGIMPSPHEVTKIWTDLVYWLRVNLPVNKTPLMQAVDENSDQAGPS